MNMHFKESGIIAFLFFCFTLLPGKMESQDHNIPFINPVHKEQLNYQNERAQAFVAKNLNRFGLERLIEYDKMLDTMYAADKKDTLESIEKNYLQSMAAKKASNIQKKNKTAELSHYREALQHRYSGMLKKAGIAFAVWLLVVFLLIQFRRRRVIKADLALNASNTQLAAIEASSGNAGILFKDLESTDNVLRKLKAETEELYSQCKAIADSPSSSKEWETIVLPKAESMMKVAGREENLLSDILVQANPPEDEKTAGDINKLCEEYLEIAYRGVKSEESDFNVQISRDLEKNLPQVKINRAAVGSVLLNVLSNAFYAVHDKSKTGVKGYQPKVSISTRILPRFLQIRIRDNGQGMNDEVIEKAMNEFFTTKPLEHGAGLGLNESRRIIMEMHKGEIKIESEKGNSTDIYIKFFTS
jgi:signal transduction histidine kinase